MEEASPSPVFSQPPGFPRRVSSIQSLTSLALPPVPTGSLDWTTSAGPLRSVWILRRSSWTLATSPPLLRRTRSSTSPYHRHSRRWLACSVVLEDISKLLREVPSMQPRRRRTSESQEQPPDLLEPKDAEIDVVLPTPLCQQPPPRPWLQADVLPSFGESEGPCLSPLLTNQHASWSIVPSGSITLHFGGDGAVTPSGSVPCADATITG